MKDEILIRYINKHCTATEEKEILEWFSRMPH
jgi:transmembrane sensor